MRWLPIEIFFPRAPLSWEMAKEHSSEAFYALDDPLEAAFFSVLVEMVKKQSEKEDTGREIEIEWVDMQVTHSNLYNY